MALRCGVTVPDFWRMTPWQLLQAVKARSKLVEDEDDARRILAWHTGNLVAAASVGKLPELARYLDRGRAGATTAGVSNHKVLAAFGFKPKAEQP